MFQDDNKTASHKEAKVVYVDEPNDGQSFGISMPQLANDMLFDKNRFLIRVFDITAVGLAITAATAMWIMHSAALSWFKLHPGLIIGLMLFELLLVHMVSASLMNMSARTSVILYGAYCILNGITLAPFLALYTDASVASAFITTSAVFLTMSCIGYATKADLSSWSSIGLMLVIGLIVAMIVNMFLASTIFDLVISICAVLIFTGLIAVDVNKIKTIGERLGKAADQESFTGLAVVAALGLYLDFVNVFIHLLKIFGKVREGKLEAGDLKM